MVIKITDLLQNYGLNGALVLYRSGQYRKFHLCDFLAYQITVSEGDVLGARTCGAFGLALAKKYPNNEVELIGKISPEYMRQLDALPNARIVTQFSDGIIYVDQHKNPLVLEHYANYFPTILAEVGNESIDAFCDCGHTCGTFAGLLASGLRENWAWFLGCPARITSRDSSFYIRNIAPELRQK